MKAIYPASRPGGVATGANTGLGIMRIGEIAPILMSADFITNMLEQSRFVIVLRRLTDMDWGDEVEEYYSLDTGWACGLLIVRDGYVHNSAPIFRKYIGRSIEYFKAIKKYKVIKLENYGKEKR